MITAKEFEKLALAQVARDAPGSDKTVFRVVLNLSRVSARMLADFESTVQRPRGLTWPGFRLLFCLWSAGPLQTRELARLLSTTAPTVSSVLNTLERRGFITRKRLPQDQRLVEASLTASGHEVIEAAFLEQHERERAWLDVLSRKELRAFVATLEVLANRHRPDDPD